MITRADLSDVLFRALSALPDIALVVDEELSIRYLNRSANGDPADFIGVSAVEHVDAEHRRVLLDAYGEAVRTQEVQAYELRSGDDWYASKLVPIVSEGKVVGATIFATNITHRKAMEEALLASQQRTKELVDALPDMTLRIDAGGRCLELRCDDSILWRSLADVFEGARIQDALPAAIAEELLSDQAASLPGQVAKPLGFELEANGVVRSLEVRARKLSRTDSVVVLRDISNLRTLAARVAATERMAALGTLIAGIAHELNNPLTYALLNLNSTLKQLRGAALSGLSKSDCEQVVDNLQCALEGTQHIQQIVRDLMSFYGSDGGQPVVIDVVEVARWSIAAVEAEEKIALGVDLQVDDPPQLRAKRSQLNQVFLNLIRNAVHALGEGASQPEAICIRLFGEQGRLVVTIKDRGCGIEPHQLSRLFDPFFTTKAEGVGTGLGLWVCHSIVASLGGEIDVQSRLAEGTTVRFSMPAIETTTE